MAARPPATASWSPPRCRYWPSSPEHSATPRLRYGDRVNLLVLGGSAFAGRAVVEDALKRGWAVTTFNRGRSPAAHRDVARLVGDRLRQDDLRQLGKGTWDYVVDAWSGAPRAAAASAALLADRAGAMPLRVERVRVRPSG